MSVLNCLKTFDLGILDFYDSVDQAGLYAEGGGSGANSVLNIYACSFEAFIICFYVLELVNAYDIGGFEVMQYHIHFVQYSVYTYMVLVDLKLIFYNHVFCVLYSTGSFEVILIYMLFCLLCSYLL